MAKYGTNFRYLGKVKNGLDRVMVVTSIPIPRFGNIKMKPINFAKCSKALVSDNKEDKYLIMTDTQASKAAKEWCVRATPYTEYLQQQEKYYIAKVHDLLCDDLYSALPKLKLMSGPSKIDRHRRGIGSLILLIPLAVESVSSWIKGKQQRRVDEAVTAMRMETQADRNKLNSTQMISYYMENIMWKCCKML